MARPIARLVVVSHKRCWASADSPSGFATDGGFPFQMRALSELFEATAIVVPCGQPDSHDGEVALDGTNVTVVPVSEPHGAGALRKINLVPWVARNLPVLLREIRRADAVHAPIPGDIGTIGMLLGLAMSKPLFVRHCGNWSHQRTVSERLWKWLMERSAGGENVMLATGGDLSPASRVNPAIGWIFATSLTEQELRACEERPQPPDPARARLIIVCRQEPAKGTGRVIDSLPKIVAALPAATLQVVGDGAALTSFRARVSEVGLTDRVTFHGNVDHPRVIQLLQSADLFCYPTSASEGFPKVVLEALACGLPVITTRVSVLPRIVGSSCGIILDDTSPESVARTVVACLSDPAKFRAMSRRAVETARRYSLERWKADIRASLTAAWGPLGSNA